MLKPAPVKETLTTLHQTYPNLKPYLHFSNPLELLVATILSAQVRDSVVNAATPALFKKYKTVKDYAQAELGELIKLLPGIGRKSANAILQNAFNIVKGIVVDTQVLRVTYRLGWTDNPTNAERSEKRLIQLLQKTEWKTFPWLMKSHGRAVCKAPIPACSICPLKHLCPRQGVVKSV